jgi:hypothetical protein
MALARPTGFDRADAIHIWIPIERASIGLMVVTASISGVDESVSAAVGQYVEAIEELLRRQLGRELVGLYLSGSSVLGDFEPATSDVDLIAITRDDPVLAVREAIVEAIDGLSCPARGLEFVLYGRPALVGPEPSLRWSINLNLGPRLPRTVWWFAPEPKPEYWVVLDLAMMRAHGRAIMGQPPAELMDPIDRAVVLGALAQSLTWHADFDRGRPNRVLNACRAWRYLLEGDLVSKMTAADWAERRTGDPVIAEARRLRAEGRLELDPEVVDAFVGPIEDAIQTAAADARTS